MFMQTAVNPQKNLEEIHKNSEFISATKLIWRDDVTWS